MNMIQDATWKELQKCETSDPYIGETRIDYMERVKSEGRYIWLPEKNELFIDIDTEDQFINFLKAYSTLEREHPNTGYRVWESKSGHPKRHICVVLPFDLENKYHRIAYQAALGSDPKREILSVFRTECDDEYPTLFAEDKRQY